MTTSTAGEPEMAPVASLFSREVIRPTLACAQCGGSWAPALVVLLDWRDRRSVDELERTISFVPCPSCGSLVDARRPIVVLRPGDPVPVLFAIQGKDPERPQLLGDLLSRHATNAQGVVVGPVANLEHELLPHIVSRYSGFAILGTKDPQDDLHEHTAGALQAWLRAVRTHHRQHTFPALSEFLNAADESEARSVFSAHQDTVDFAAWLPALRAPFVQPAGGPDGLRQVEKGRVVLLSHLLTVGTDFVRDDAQKYIDLLQGLTDFHQSGEHIADAVNAATTQARELVAVAEATYGPAHPMTLTAKNDAATLMMDQPAMYDEAVSLLSAARVDAARSGERILADVTTNLGIARLSQTRIPSADAYEEAIATLKDAQHLYWVLEPHEPTSRVGVIVNLAAVIRSRLTRSETLNTAEAMELLTELEAALDASDHSDKRLGAVHDRITRQMNAVNTLATDAQLYREPTRDAALDEAMKALAQALENLPETHPVRVRALANLGSIAADRLARDAGDHDLRIRAERWLEDAIEATTNFEATDVTRILARMNLAALLTTTADLDGDPSEAQVERAIRLLTDCATDLAATPSSRLHQTVFSNLAQAHLMRGDTGPAIDALQRAVDHADVLIRQARTPATRLGQAATAGDLTQRLAFLHAHARDARSTIHAIERARARWRGEAEDLDKAELDRRVARALDPDTALLYAGTCALGTYALIVTPKGSGAFTWAIPTTLLHPILGALSSGRSNVVSEALQAASSHLGATLVDAVLGMAETTAVRQLRTIWGGPLTALPMAHLAGNRGTLSEHLAIDNLVGLQPADDSPTPPPDDGVVAAAIVDPTGDLLFARTEVEALHTYATTVVEPTHRGIKGWLMDNVHAVNHLHLACHGETDPDEPFNSRFHLGDDLTITVGELAEIDLHGINLVVATSCRSGLVDQRAADEQVGLGAALLAAGARGVVAALWDLDDLGTSVVVAKFYQRLNMGDQPNVALATAQRWVATATTADILAATEQPGAHNVWLPLNLASELRALCLHPAHRDADARPLNDPARWAALVYLS